MKARIINIQEPNEQQREELILHTSRGLPIGYYQERVLTVSSIENPKQKHIKSSTKAITYIFFYRALKDIYEEAASCH